MAIFLLSLASTLATVVAPEPVRLVGHTDAGRVEILLQGRWRWICLRDDSSWGRKEADVVCRQLGLRRGVDTMRASNGDKKDVARNYGDGFRDPHRNIQDLTGVECDGSEESILKCQFRYIKHSLEENLACSKSSAPAAAGVRCTNFVPEEQPLVVLGGQGKTADLLKAASYHLHCGSEPLGDILAAEHHVTLPTFACVIMGHDMDESAQANMTGSCSDASEGCSADRNARLQQSLQGASDPFRRHEALRAFVFKEEMSKTLLYSAGQREYFLGLYTSGPVNTWGQRGARWHPIGLDLTCVVNPRSRLCPQHDPSEAGYIDEKTLSKTSWTDLVAVKAAYFSPVARVLFDLDSDVIGLTGRKNEGSMRPRNKAAASMFDELEAHGLVELGDLGLPQELIELGLKTSRESGSSTELGASQTRLPALEEWLRQNSTIQAAVSAYLGGHAMLHGYKTMHLPDTMPADSYVSSSWHHDRAGRRLKFFIRLNDVDEKEGHPTKVAKGSHQNVYYWAEELSQSRYTDRYVRQEYEVVSFNGKAGTGYIFDTNALHKGTVEGSQPRDVIVVEYHHAAKCGLVMQMGLNIPCPSGDQRPLNLYVSLDKVNHP